MSRPVLVVPPLIAYGAGPLLGPSMLAGAARSIGVHVEVVDLNISTLRVEGGSAAPDIVSLRGDHAKPVGRFRDARLRERGRLAAALGPLDGSHPAGQDPVWELMADFDTVDAAALAEAESARVRAWIERLGDRPSWLGVSVMFAGQVVNALALSVAAKRAWPGLPVIWGGAHVTALAPEIARDTCYGRFVDGFVSGYAERTFQAMLRADDPRDVGEVFSAGSGAARRARGDASIAPAFGELGAYGSPYLTLPAQVSRGCAYGRCAFCTYPSIEGDYDPGSVTHVEPTIRLAESLGADIAFKDALMTRPQLRLVAQAVDRRARFAVTTRVRPRPERDLATLAARAGLSTVELGLETIDPERLRTLDKRQSLHDLRVFLQDFEALPVHVVLNVMYGYSDQSLESGQAELEEVAHVAAAVGGAVTLERNLLQVQRRSPMGVEPERFGVRVTRSWPWSTSLGWDAPAWRSEQWERFTGHLRAEHHHG